MIEAMADDGSPKLAEAENRYRRVAWFWVVVSIIVAIGVVILCVIAATWLFDYAIGPDATLGGLGAHLLVK